MGYVVRKKESPEKAIKRANEKWLQSEPKKAVTAKDRGVRVNPLKTVYKKSFFQKIWEV